MATFTTDINSIPVSRRKNLEANAQGQGMTAAEYLASRGGLNLVTGKFGDSFDAAKDLSDAEYLAIKAQGGNVGAAINAATNKKAGITEAADSDAATTVVTDPDVTAAAAAAKAERTSAYNVLLTEFTKYGLGSLVSDVKNYLINSTFDPSEFSIELQNTDAYKLRFSANKDRLAKGLSALKPAEYIALEDQYQNVMRNYGLPASYYAKDPTGKQAGFDQLIANDVDNMELEDRVMIAQQRVMNSNPEVLASLKAFYPDITNGDILAYTLDPKNALDNIKRKVTSAEIGGAATQAGLKTGVTRAEELAAAGITKAKAQEGFETVAGGAPRGGQLASMYGENPYTQATAETEVFGLAGKTEAATQRKKVTGLEKATFGGQSGATSSALVRDRAGAY
jgi:hypothetical protein